jgi:O-antigen ligase
MSAWLLEMADSKTTLSALILGTAIFLLLRWGALGGRFLGTAILVLLVAIVAAKANFDVSAMLIKVMGRDPTLTDRTLLWADVLALRGNFLFGTGFESFWLGERLEILWAKWPWMRNQAHNGSIETYLNLGAVGIALLFGMLVATFPKIKKQFATDFDPACLRLALLLAIISYNYAETAFEAVHFV